MKKNNKGFSLVELIIVIAIMAVLVGVLAPTYLQYVEKSKKSNDAQTVDSIVNALEICAIDPEVQVAGDWEITIKITNSGTTYTGVGTKAGNRLTKSFTVSCRGKANDELQNYGTVFTLSVHPTKEGLFVMQGDKAPEAVVDDKVEIKDDASEVEVEIDLDDFIADENEVEEISALDFKL